MQALHTYDELGDIWAELEHLKERVYEINSEESRNEFCSRLNQIQHRIAQLRDNEVLPMIKEEWL